MGKEMEEGSWPIEVIIQTNDNNKSTEDKQ